MKLAWATDLHLDHCDQEAYALFIEQVQQSGAHHLALTGDIADGRSLISWLARLRSDSGLPIFFVLGNHDYYGAGIERLREEVAAFVFDERGLVYLSIEASGFFLNRETILIGHDGWADGRAGDYDKSQVMLTDYVLIEELAGLDKMERRKRLEELSAQSVDHLVDLLGKVSPSVTKIYCLTHSPPFLQACLYEGRPSDAEWAPHFVNLALGEALIEQMRSDPNRELIVLCGHSHHAASYSPLSNLHIQVGGATYGSPQLQGTFLL